MPKASLGVVDGTDGRVGMHVGEKGSDVQDLTQVMTIAENRSIRTFNFLAHAKNTPCTSRVGVLLTRSLEPTFTAQQNAGGSNGGSAAAGRRKTMRSGPAKNTGSPVRGSKTDCLGTAARQIVKIYGF